MNNKLNKYQALSPSTIARVQQDIQKRYPSKLQEQELKSKLHQIWGAYYTSRPDFNKLSNKILKALQASENVQDVLKQTMLIHQSTKERLPILEDFYKNIFEITGIPNSIIDHACGFNPLTLPWMHLPKSTHYTAYDIDTEEIIFLNNTLQILGYSDQARCEVGDIYDYQGEYADIIFMLKLVPLLEQQHKGSTEHIIQKQNCKFLVVSFPTKSIGGKNKGMQENYSTNFEYVLNNLDMNKYSKIEYDTEIIYAIVKN